VLVGGLLGGKQGKLELRSWIAMRGLVRRSRKIRHEIQNKFAGREVWVGSCCEVVGATQHMKTRGKVDP
jgi:hypothetical protein